MTATTATVQCTSRGCSNPATHTLPAYIPGETREPVCGTCFTVYWDCRRALAAERY